MYITTSIAIGSRISVSSFSNIDESEQITYDWREEAKTKCIKTKWNMSIKHDWVVLQVNNLRK